MATDILNRPANLQIFRVEKNPCIQVFFLVQNISKTINVFKNRGHIFKVISSTSYIQKIRNMFTMST